MRHLVQFRQVSRHDGEVGRRLPHILDSLHEEAVDNLTQKKRTNSIASANHHLKQLVCLVFKQLTFSFVLRLFGKNVNNKEKITDH